MNNYEHSLIGILLTDAFWLRDPEPLIDAMDIARREYFSTDFAKITYSAILKVIQMDAVPDVELVDELLKDNLIYKQQDGKWIITQALKESAGSANAIEYAERVREEYFLRDAKIRLSDALQELEKGGRPKTKIAAALELASGISTDYDAAKQDCSFTGALGDMIDHLETVSKAGGKITGIDTGFFKLNEITFGLQNGNTIVVAGVPGAGKTTFCLNIMTHAAEQNKKKVLFYSLEMPKHEICMKICSNMTNIQMQDFQSAEVISDTVKNKVLMSAMERLNAMPFHIDDDPTISAETIENRTKRHAMEMGGIDLICVDYLTLMDAQGESETVKASNAAKALKRLSKKFNCPVIIISQLVKNLVGRPTKSDLRQTGQLGQDASLIMLLYKDENQITNNGDPKLIELIVDKNRMGEQRDIVLQPQFQFNRLIETEAQVMYQIDDQGVEIKNPKKRSIARVS